jgi:hypothetical protein
MSEKTGGGEYKMKKVLVRVWWIGKFGMESGTNQSSFSNKKTLPLNNNDVTPHSLGALFLAEEDRQLKLAS